MNPTKLLWGILIQCPTIPSIISMSPSAIAPSPQALKLPFPLHSQRDSTLVRKIRCRSGVQSQRALWGERAWGNWGNEAVCAVKDRSKRVDQYSYCEWVEAQDLPWEIGRGNARRFGEAQTCEGKIGIKSLLVKQLVNASDVLMISLSLFMIIWKIIKSWSKTPQTSCPQLSTWSSNRESCPRSSLSSASWSRAISWAAISPLYFSIFCLCFACFPLRLRSLRCWRDSSREWKSSSPLFWTKIWAFPVYNPQILSV